MLGDLFYRLGSAAGTLTAQFSAPADTGGSGPQDLAVYDGGAPAVHGPEPTAHAAAEPAHATLLDAEPESEPAEEPDGAPDRERESGPDTEPTDEDGKRSAALIGAAWILSTAFRARPVNWPRVILSGVAATALADLVGRLEGPAVTGVTGVAGVAGHEPFARDRDELKDRLGAGVAIAAGYAAILYPRIPGPPLFRGLVFGAIEVATAPLGGLVRVAAAAPGVRFPLQRMITRIDENAGPVSLMAFGVALGLLYRND